tara:strand:- start:225 stop:662 length:438 start_codon:yes stop_codon:yes gene_type:complete
MVKVYTARNGAQYIKLANGQCRFISGASRTYLNKIRKMRGGKRKLINSKKKSCLENDMTTCCPHMEPNNDGEYAATTSMKPLSYRGKKYELYTCCQMCADNMNKLSKDNPDKFDNYYKVKLTKEGHLKLANKHTKEYVQIAKLMK